MTVSSMTGFARTDGHDGLYSWAWEAKSVNGRALDVRCRLPGGMDWLEPVARKALVERFHRGHIALSLTLHRPPGQLGVRLNRALLDQLLAALGELGSLASAAPPRLDGLLAVPGVVEIAEVEESPEAREAREKAMVDSLFDALDDLVVVRREEGERLTSALRHLIEEIANLVSRAEGCAALQPEAIKSRLREQVAALLEAAPSLPEERIAQEAALLGAKADVREELDRLRAHLAAARNLVEDGAAMEDGVAVGRRLDFIAQELNREVNTLCSKSTDVELTQIGLDLKALIDQFREQVQNIE